MASYKAVHMRDFFFFFEESRKEFQTQRTKKAGANGLLAELFKVCIVNYKPHLAEQVGSK